MVKGNEILHDEIHEEHSEFKDQRDQLSLHVLLARWGLKMGEGPAPFFRIFSIQSNRLIYSDDEYYITPCSAMLGTERGRIVDGRWGYRVARSRNEICVTRGPMSPGLALLLLSSVQPGVVQFCSRRVARYIIQLCHSSYTHGPAKVWRGQRANRSNERGERDRKTVSPSLPPASWQRRICE